MLGNALTTVTANTNSATTTNLIPEDTNLYLPGAVPTNLNALNRFLNYQRDTSIPKHHMQWNFIVDLPVGKGKRFLLNSNQALNAVIWRMATLPAREP